MLLEVWFFRVPRFFSLPYLVRSFSIQLNDYPVFLTEFYGQCLILPDSLPLGESILQPVVEDFSYIVNHAVEQPLDVGLDLPSYGKTIHGLPGTDVRKNRLGMAIR